MLKLCEIFHALTNTKIIYNSANKKELPNYPFPKCHWLHDSFARENTELSISVGLLLSAAKRKIYH